jgi:CheY-like chemotaxis protein
MLQGKLFLVVDDEPDLREILRDELEFEEAQVHEAANGKEAFELFKKHKFDGVLTDIRMPGGDGVTLAREIKSITQEGPPVILMTGFADMNPQEAFNLGVEGFFAKPFNLETIRKSVSQLILPRSNRWALPSQEPIAHTYTLPMDFAAAVTQGRLSIGRGGAFLGLLSPGAIKVGDLVKVAVGSDFRGEGYVRWIRGDFEGESTPGVGIEFSHLDAQSIELAEAQIQKNSPRAFIPKK